MNFRLPLHRVRTDFRIGVLMFFGVCAVFGLLPFAVYRFLSGQFMIGLLDTIIVLTIAGSGLYALYTAETRRPALILIFVTNAGGVLMSTIHPNSVLWMYPAFVANFFVVGRWTASVVTLISLLALIIHGGAFASHLERFTFMATALLVSLFSFIFAHRSDEQRLHLLALTREDPLTGLQNRRAMEGELQIAVETHRRHRVPFGLIVIDLDHFKAINDVHGHEAGDKVLRAFSEVIRGSTRQSDRTFRFGGEEFAVLLPGTDLESLETIGENFRRRTAALFEKSPPGITISLGAAALDDDEEWPVWLARADAALYRAKKTGRDRVVVDPGRSQSKTSAI